MWIVIIGAYKYGPFKTVLLADKWAKKSFGVSTYQLQKLTAP